MTAPELRAAQTIAEARRILARAFVAAGLDAADTGARVLLEFALGLDRAGLFRAGERPLTEDEAERLRALAHRRLQGAPLAHVTGRREFWGLDLAVTPATLVPRPDTETLVDAALALLAEAGPRDAPWRLADLGTGSGAILLALLHELPNACGVGTDIGAQALAVARRNAAALGLGPRCGFLQGNFADALAPGVFDLVASNPPYVATGDIARLAPAVRDHEPRAALDGGTDGLDAYRALARDGARLLGPRGTIVVEIGAGQAEAVKALFRRAGLQARGGPFPDLASIPRVLAFARR